MQVDRVSSLEKKRRLEEKGSRMMEGREGWGRTKEEPKEPEKTWKRSRMKNQSVMSSSTRQSSNEPSDRVPAKGRRVINEHLDPS
jgi:hypothetical protein